MRSKESASSDRVPITLRPPKVLLERYTNAAADRTREFGRVVSANILTANSSTLNGWLFIDGGRNRRNSPEPN